MSRTAKRLNAQDLTHIRNDLKSLSQRFKEHQESVHSDLDKKFDGVINAIDKLTNETKAIVELHQDLQATLRVGKSLQEALLWSVKWGAIGAAIGTFLKWVLKT